MINNITYAGHSAVFLGTDSGSIGIDPWVTGNPSWPKDFEVPGDLKLVVLTHGHADHASDAGRLCRQYGAKLVAIYELAMLIAGEGVPEENIIPMNRGGKVTIEGITIALTMATHSSSYNTAEGAKYAGEACGVIVSDGTTCVYHSGDTGLFSDMRLIGDEFKPTHAMLPIGDHFTMGPKIAAEAAGLVGCKAAIPIHYKTFEILTGTLEEFTSECSKRSIAVIPLKPGETLEV